MINSLVETTIRTTVGVVRLVALPGLRLARRLAEVAFPPPRPEARPAPPPRPASAAPSQPAQSPSGPRGVPGRDIPPPRLVDPHDELNTPVGEPDPTEWPDPYDRREDPRDPNPDDPLPIGDVPHTPTGAQSTSAPHPDQDPEATASEHPVRRDRR